jgi:hypothetical protein
MQSATVAASIGFGAIAPERSGVVAPLLVVVGLALLVTGTHANLWWLVVLATLLVGASAGVASGDAFAVAGRIGRGQRPRIFARLLVAGYLGYSLPALLTGFIASRTTFAVGFACAVLGLGIIALAIPVLRWRSDLATSKMAVA